MTTSKEPVEGFVNKPRITKEEPEASGPQVIDAAETNTLVRKVLKRLESMETEIGDRIQGLEGKVRESLSLGLTVEEIEKAVLGTEKLGKKEKKRLGKALRSATRIDANWLEKAVFWAEETTNGWLPAVAKTAGYGFLGYAGVRGAIQGTRFAVRSIRGDVAGAIEAATNQP